MITVSVLIVVWVLYACYKHFVHRDNYDYKYDSFIELGLTIGVVLLTIILSIIILLCIKYLP